MRTLQEMKLKNQFKNNKAAGIDEIPNELLKTAPEQIIHLFVDLFKTILETGIMPETWCL